MLRKVLHWADWIDVTAVIAVSLYAVYAAGHWSAGVSTALTMLVLYTLAEYFYFAPRDRRRALEEEEMDDG